MDHLIQYLIRSARTPHKIRAAFDALGLTMESRMTALETRFDAILPTLATKEDLKNLEVSLHRDLRSNTWLMITWITAVVSMAMTGVCYVARYVPV
jgi:DMSO reductase anchor subunit